MTASGVNIYSTYKCSKSTTLSRTSMTAHYVSGIADLALSVLSKCDFDLNRICNTVEIQ